MRSELGNLTSTVYSTPTILLNVQPGASEAKTIYFLHFVTCFRLKVLFPSKLLWPTPGMASQSRPSCYHSECHKCHKWCQQMYKMSMIVDQDLYTQIKATIFQLILNCCHQTLKKVYITSEISALFFRLPMKLLLQPIPRMYNRVRKSFPFW